MSTPFVVECRSDAGTIDLELEARTFSHAVHWATLKRKEYDYVTIRKTMGLRHGEPIKWKWSRDGQEWRATTCYDQYAAGSRVPRTHREGDPSLFGERDD